MEKADGRPFRAGERLTTPLGIDFNLPEACTIGWAIRAEVGWRFDLIRPLPQQLKWKVMLFQKVVWSERRDLNSGPQSAGSRARFLSQLHKQTKAIESL